MSKKIKKFEEKMKDKYQNKPVFPEKRSSLFGLETNRFRNTLTRQSLVLGSSRRSLDIFSEFERKFEDNTNQITDLQTKIININQEKAEIEKENVIIQREKDFLEKDVSILRKEKDHYHKMYKNAEADLKRIKASQDYNIKMTEAKYKNRIFHLQKEIDEFKNDLDKSRSINMDYGTNKNGSQELNNGKYKRKISLLEKNFNRVMKDKRAMLEKNKELKQTIEDQLKRIEKLEEKRNSSFRKSKKEYGLIEFYIGKQSSERTKVDENVQTEFECFYEKYKECQGRYNKQLKINEEIIEENKNLMLKINDLIERDIKTQSKMEALRMDKNLHAKFIQENASRIN